MSEEGAPPLGFVATNTIESRLGRIEIFERESGAAFPVRPRGYIGPTLVRRDLALARIFGERHPLGWDYVADMSGVRAANPLNVLWLRRIRALPHVRRHVVIAPSAWMRLAIRSMGWCVRSDEVLVSLEGLDTQ